jgi:hypothetical protein
VVRFRKSKSFGGIRLTASKSGLSVSSGVPGLRVSVNSRGQVRRTVRVPGTGISDTKVLGSAATNRRRGTKNSASAETLSPEVRITAVDATGGSRNLRSGDVGVASAQVVGVKDHASVAKMAGLVPRADGWLGGLRQGVLVEQGSEYRAIVLIGPEDNPRLFNLKQRNPDVTPRAAEIGRLAKRDHDKWAPAFAGRSIAVVVFITATPGVSGTAEVRFRPDELDETDDTPAEPAGPVAPAGWYRDPRGIARLRWWDGESWTDHTVAG